MINTNMGKKFDAVFESVVQRYQAGGFLTGDNVKLTSDYKSSDAYKSMHPQMKKELDELGSSGLNLIVTQIGDKLSGASAGNQFKTADNAVITIAADQGGGRHYGFITLSPNMLELVDNGVNRPKVPEQFRRRDEVIIKPEKYKADPKNITRVTDKGNGKNTPTNLKLAGESIQVSKDIENLANLWEQTTKN